MYHEQPELSERQVRGLKIVSLNSKIKRKNKIRYKVRSDSEEGLWYDVIKTIRSQYRWASKRTLDMYLSRLSIPTSILQTHLCNWIFETTQEENSFPSCCTVVNTTD